MKPTNKQFAYIILGILALVVISITAHSSSSQRDWLRDQSVIATNDGSFQCTKAKSSLSGIISCAQYQRTTKVAPEGSPIVFNDIKKGQEIILP